MKFFAALAIIPAIVSAATVSLSYDETYDASGTSLAVVACSNGSNGLLTQGFTTFGSLHNFPNIGGAPAVTGFNSPACGTCWQVTYTNGKGVKKSINVLAIDVGLAGFNIAKAAMNTLTGGQAVALGRVNVDAVQVAESACGL
ncbi:cerato-platanin-related secreted protein [Macrolepiota fuliginosa MF-IS2]|uniref:Cerato-platanin-related secreted protein n=1 Tax=Macrolepiota fuliginosa MF-IS2 TaxID=1400762 RepID=A0A9P5XLD4_9AGAR|nr:cerato-platanin-related secreted protein [Macrolepiota fuliginosa MF-IS2]